MGPIEVLWGTVVLVFVMVTLVRGYTKELGITILLLLALFVEVYFGPRIESVLTTKVFAQVFKLLNVNENQELQNLLLSLTFQGVLVLVLYLGYEGRTLSFPGAPAKGLEGFLLNVFIGVVNGWLFAGSIWYYMHKYDYPYLVKWGLLQKTWTDTAETLMKFMPPKLFEGRPEVLAAFAAILIFFSIRR